MELKDAEYQEWFNEPCIGHWSKEPLDNKKVLCEYWSLKDGTNVRVVGTELQCYRLYEVRILKEGWQLSGSWIDELLPEYLDAYKDNNKKPIIINLK